MVAGGPRSSDWLGHGWRTDHGAIQGWGSGQEGDVGRMPRCHRPCHWRVQVLHRRGPRCFSVRRSFPYVVSSQTRGCGAVSWSMLHPAVAGLGSSLPASLPSRRSSGQGRHGISGHLSLKSLTSFNMEFRRFVWGLPSRSLGSPPPPACPTRCPTTVR